MDAMLRMFLAAHQPWLDRLPTWPGLFVETGEGAAGGKETGDGATGEGADGADDGDGGEDPTAELAKWKAMARKHEKQAKDNAAAAKRLADLEEAGKSEQQKAADKAAQAEKDAADARKELARLRVAMRKGLTEAQAKRLVGDTEEELEADAEELLESFGAEKNGDGKDDRSRRPQERLRAGASSDDGDPQEKDPGKLAALIPRQ